MMVIKMWRGSGKKRKDVLSRTKSALSWKRKLKKKSHLPYQEFPQEYAIWTAIDQAWKDTLRVSLHEKLSKKHRSSICEPTVGFFLMKVLVYLYHPGPTSFFKHTFPHLPGDARVPSPAISSIKPDWFHHQLTHLARCASTQVIPTFGWMIIWSLYLEWSFQNLDPKWVMVTGMILETMQIDWCLKLEGNSTIRPVFHWKFYWCFNIITVSSRYINMLLINLITTGMTMEEYNELTIWLPWATWSDSWDEICKILHDERPWPYQPQHPPFFEY